MARRPSPWYRSSRKSWHVTIRGEKHYLGPPPAGAKPPEKSKKTGLWNHPPEIAEAFRRLLDGRPAEADSGDTVIAVLDDFITWCKENRSALTAGRYEEFVQDFVSSED